MRSSPLLVLLLFLSFGFDGSNDGNPIVSISADTAGWPVRFGFGRAASPKEIAALDISIRPDGKRMIAGPRKIKIAFTSFSE